MLNALNYEFMMVKSYVFAMESFQNMFSIDYNVLRIFWIRFFPFSFRQI